MVLRGSEMVDFPELREYQVGDLWAKQRSDAIRYMTRLMFGPGDLGGVVVDYRKVDIGLKDVAPWPRLEGLGPQARPGMRRTWHHAACLAIPAALVEEVEKIYGADTVRPAVARVTHSGDVVAGPLPQGTTFGLFKPYEDESEAWRTMLCRVGPRAVIEIATPALLYGDKLLVPDKAEVLDEFVVLDKSLWWGKTRTPVV